MVDRRRTCSNNDTTELVGTCSCFITLAAFKYVVLGCHIAEGCSFWTHFSLIWPQIHYQPIEVTSMVQLLSPVQVKGSVMENCCEEERTGKLEPAENLPTLVSGGNSVSLTGAVEV